MSQVEVSAAVLAWALKRSGHDFVDLGERFKHVDKWIDGDKRPTLRQLEDFARATHTPLGLLFLDAPPTDVLPIPHYRTYTGDAVKEPSVDLIETIQMMEYRQVWMREYLRSQGIERLAGVGGAKVGEAPETVAARMRDVIGLQPGWARGCQNWEGALKKLSVAIEDAGIVVVVNGIVGNDTHRKLDPEEFRGFVLADDLVPLIFVNGVDAKRAQMFTLAHELAHVVFGFSAAFDLREMAAAPVDTERACDSAAAEFLLPAQEFRSTWQRTAAGQGAFRAVADQFHVSDVVVARRAYDLRLIDHDQFEEFYEAYVQSTRAENAKNSGGNFYSNQPYRIGRKFGRAVVRALHEGKLLYTEAYRMTGLYGATFDKFAQSIGSGAGK